MASGVMLNHFSASAARPYTFGENITRLIQAGAILKSQARQPDAFRRLRNNSSHPNFQEIVLPGIALGLLRASTQNINQLLH